MATPPCDDGAVKRIGSLDSLRGLAALVVVFGHCAAVVPGYLPWSRTLWLVPPPLAAAAAVQLFFVLSGLVLFLTLRARDGFRYRPYIVKRVARIWPPLVVAVMVSATLMILVAPQPVPGLSDWFNTASWIDPPTPLLVAGHLALLDGDRWQSLDNVSWSLVHEMRISLVFPLIALAVLRAWRTTLAALLLVSTGAAAVAWRVDWALNPFATAQYLFLFGAGAALALHAPTLGLRLATPAARRAAPLLAIVAVLAVCVPPRLLLGLLCAAGAALLVALALASPPIVALLDVAPARWLGRVSYALYLIHLPVLLATLHLLHGAAPLPVLLVLAVGLALVAAELMHRLVEKPAIALGRFLVRPAPAPVSC
jgi:peptidoglycan/LPS O-acetylase OafA/YrhL